MQDKSEFVAMSLPRRRCSFKINQADEKAELHTKALGKAEFIATLLSRRRCNFKINQTD